jgi:adenosylmethionine-8-amino-7-oxononanoate aminotransferase
MKRGAPIQAFYGSAQLPVIDRAEGVYMWDSAGKRYLDGSSGPIVANIGHGNKRVLAALAAQAARVCFASRAVFENTPNRALAERLVGLAGPAFDQAFIVSGGSEATEAALKLARQYTVAIGAPDRWKVLSRMPSYHGASLGAVSVTGDPDSEAMFAPIARMMPKIPAPMTYRLPDNHDADSYARHCAQALEAAILTEGPGTVLAFIMEPVGGLSTGATVAPGHYMKAVRDICTRHGVLLIFDEVMSGAGRTGAFLAADHWPDATPDIVTLAKGLAAGYTPLGAVLAPNRIVEPVVAAGGFMHGHTYAANPLSCAIGDAVLAEVVDQGMIANAARMGVYLAEALRPIAEASRIIGDIRGKGLLMAAEIVANKATKAMLPNSARAVYRLLEIGTSLGLMLYSRKTAGGAFGEWLMIAPPLNITQAECDELVRLFAATIAAFEDELSKQGLI